MSEATSIRITKQDRMIIEQNTEFMKEDSLPHKMRFIIRDYVRLKQIWEEENEIQ